jgi:PII-like signaling protein
MEGFGAHSRIHTTKILRLSEDLPIVIELVDREERIQQILPILDGMVTEGLITVEKAHIIAYRPGKAPDE